MTRLRVVAGLGRRLRRGTVLALVVALVAGAAAAGVVVVVRLRAVACSAAGGSQGVTPAPLAPAAAVAAAAPSVGVAEPVAAEPRTQLRVGVYTPGFPGSTGSLDGITAAIGRRPDIVMWYVHWGGPVSGVDVASIRAVLARGAVPMITWMSDDPTAPGYPDAGGQTAYRDSTIAGGADDAYIRAWAAGLRGAGGPVMIRLDHEMNCDWSPWAAGVAGQTAADYVAMWRHVHRVFDEMGVGNVEWVWSPNVAAAGPAPLRALYPGDDTVDAVGLDGYNWGTSQRGKHWESFDDIFAASIADIATVSRRPLLLTEVGCAEAGGDKAAWIADFLARVSGLGQVSGFVWFDADKETDWRIDSSPAAAAAFRAGLARLPS